VAVVAVACCVNVSAAAALVVAVVSGVAVSTYLFHHSSTPVEFTVGYTEYSFGFSLHIAWFLLCAIHSMVWFWMGYV
jgi:hypothetical protein